VERCRALTVIAFLTLASAAPLGLVGCGGGAASTSPSPSWTPALRLTASATSFKWTGPTRLRGTLLPKAWTYTSSFPLPSGPATVVGILKVPGTTWPGFTARLMPDQHAPGFAGYAAVDTSLWHMPAIGAGEAALKDWFPYALPAGSYRVMMRQVGGRQSGGTYDIRVAGVR